MSVEDLAKQAVEAAMQSIIDNGGEIEIQDGNVRTKNASPDQIAKLIDACNAAGINLKTSTTKRTIGVRIG